MIPRERVWRRVAVAGPGGEPDLGIAGPPLGDGDAADGSDSDGSFSAPPA